MENTKYWMRRVETDTDSFYMIYEVVAKELEQKLGKVLIEKQDDKFVVLVERDDMGKRHFDTTCDENHVSELAKSAASDLSRA